MTDARLRELERRAATDPAADLALVAERARLGLLEPLDPEVRKLLRERAWNGDEVAEALLLHDWDRVHRVETLEIDGQPRVGVKVGDAHPWRFNHEEDPMPEQVNPVTVIPTGQVMAVARKTPLWDRDVCAGGRIGFFESGYKDALGEPKRGPFYEGWMPRSSSFYAYQVILLVDAGQDEEKAQRLWNDGIARLEMPTPSSARHEWPVRAIMPPPRPIPTSEAARCRMFLALGGRDMTVEHQPVHFRPQEWFRVRVEAPGCDGLRAMFAFFGIEVRGISH